MADLDVCSNSIIGSPTTEYGARFFSNWSLTSTSGITCPEPITIAKKVEAPPPVFSDDPDNDFPGLFIERTGWPSGLRLGGNKYEVSFTFNVHIVVKATDNTRPKEVAQTAICKIVVNLMESDKLGLDYIDMLDFQGIEGSTGLAAALSAIHPAYAMGTASFRVVANLAFD